MCRRHSWPCIPCWTGTETRDSQQGLSASKQPAPCPYLRLKAELAGCKPAIRARHASLLSLAHYQLTSAVSARVEIEQLPQERRAVTQQCLSRPDPCKQEFQGSSSLLCVHTQCSAQFRAMDVDVAQILTQWVFPALQLREVQALRGTCQALRKAVVQAQPEVWLKVAR